MKLGYKNKLFSLFFLSLFNFINNNKKVYNIYIYKFVVFPYCYSINCLSKIISMRDAILTL